MDCKKLSLLYVDDGNDGNVTRIQLN